MKRHTQSADESAVIYGPTLGRGVKPRLEGDAPSFAALPADILRMIFQLLPPRTCGRVLTLVCRRWRELAHRSITCLHLRHPFAVVPLLPSVTEMHVEVTDNLPEQFFSRLRVLSIYRRLPSSSFSSLLCYTELTSLHVDFLDDSFRIVRQNAQTLTSLRIREPVQLKDKFLLEGLHLRSLRCLDVAFDYTSASVVRLLLPLLSSQLVELCLTDNSPYHSPAPAELFTEQFLHLRSLSLWNNQFLVYPQVAAVLRNAPQLRNWYHLNWPSHDYRLHSCTVSVRIRRPEHILGFVAAFEQFSRLTELHLSASNDGEVAALKPICSRIRKLTLKHPLPDLLAACAPYLVELDTQLQDAPFIVPTSLPWLRKLTLKGMTPTLFISESIRAFIRAAPVLTDLEVHRDSLWPYDDLRQFLREHGPAEGYSVRP